MKNPPFYLALILITLCGLTGFLFFRTSKISSEPSQVPVLMYHGFTRDHAGQQFSMPIELFETQMKYLVENNYHSILSTDYIKALDGNRKMASRAVVLTFDDWTPEQFHLARPILNSLGLKGIFFVITDKIASESDREELRTLAREGHEIGSHTVHHYFLTQTPCDQAWKCCQTGKPCEPNEIRSELNDSKISLESILKKPILSFAWPGNFFGAESLRLAKELGYRATFAVEDQKMENGVLMNRAGRTVKPELIYRTEIDGRCNLTNFKVAVAEGRCCVVSDRKFYRQCLPQSLW